MPAWGTSIRSGSGWRLNREIRIACDCAGFAGDAEGGGSRPATFSALRASFTPASRRPLGGFHVEADHEVDDARRDLGAEARAVEDAVMADARLEVVHALVGRDVDAEVVRRLRLADAGNVVVLALDRQQRDVADRRRDRRGSPRCIISPFGSAWRTKTVSTVCR